eukprot:4941654-Pyramimonas_sp.AAC.1
MMRFALRRPEVAGHRGIPPIVCMHTRFREILQNCAGADACDQCDSDQKWIRIKERATMAASITRSELQQGPHIHEKVGAAEVNSMTVRAIARA